MGFTTFFIYFFPGKLCLPIYPDGGGGSKATKNITSETRGTIGE